MSDPQRDDHDETKGVKPARMRSDVQRNAGALLEAALAVFATSGVDAPVREIASRAGVGVGTVYRHFPQRSDLIAAVFRREVDACAAAAPSLALKHGPSEALALWMERYAAFISTKRGLAAALHSGDPAFESLPDYFQTRLKPALLNLLDAAVAAGEIRADANPDELLQAIGSLCMSTYNTGPAYTKRMIALIVDGLRYGANQSAN
jgi:AcrR family transcriptional regulator